MLNFRGPLIADLVARGHHVTAIAPDMTPTIAAALRAAGADPIEISLNRTGLNPLQDMYFILSLRHILRQLQADATLSYAIKPVVFGTIAAWLAGVPRRFALVEGLGYVFIQRPGETLARRGLRAMVTRLYKFAFERAEKVLFLNTDDIADLTALSLLPPSKAICIGGIGVDLSLWQPASVAAAPITFTLVARLLRDKGVVEFVEAARLIKAAHPETRFLLVGGLDSNPESVRQDEVDRWVAEGLVEWPGHVPVAPLMAETSVFVLPSYYREGVPRSTQEAMAMARAVITTDAVGCRDTVEDGVNGFLVPTRDAPSLADAMRRFIDNPNLIADMGHQSRRLAEERFDVRKVNARIIDILGL